MNILIKKFLLNMFSLLALIALMALLSGCATPATSIGMIPTKYEIFKKHAHTVHVIVTGGSETSAMWKPQISDEDFSLTLTEAINSSEAFSKVIQGAGADYLLYVAIFTIEQPLFGASFTVKMEIGWTLKRADNKVTVWQESIKSEHTTTMSEAFAAVTRLRLATEGAARENIAAGLARISKLTL
jgi:hypothetical protein